MSLNTYSMKLTFAGLLVVEEVLDELLDLGDTSRTSDEDDLINLFLLHVSILQYVLHWLHC